MNYELKQTCILNNHHKSSNVILQELQEIELAKHNPEKFAVLYERYFKSIFLFVFKRTNDEDISADITSQVFLKALINISKYQFKGVPFSAWLYRIAFNEINLYFRNNKSSRFVNIDENGILNILVEVKENDSTELQHKIMNAVKKLNLKELQLIELRFFEKHSFAEVGIIVGTTENNAKVKVYRILDKLKKMM